MLERKNWSDDIFDLKKLCVNLILEKNSSITRLNITHNTNICTYFYSSILFSYQVFVYQKCDLLSNDAKFIRI